MCSLHFPSNESILNYFLSCSSLSELQFPISDCPSQDELFQKASVTEWLRLEGTSGDCLVHHPAQAGSRGAGCPGPCPSGFSISPMKEMPQPLWATCTGVQPVRMVLLFLQKKPKEMLWVFSLYAKFWTLFLSTTWVLLLLGTEPVIWQTKTLWQELTQLSLWKSCQKAKIR